MALCPFLAKECIREACQLWLVQYRQNEDGSRSEFSNCAVNVLAVTQMRQVTEQIRTTATTDALRATVESAPRAILSAITRQRIMP